MRAPLRLVLLSVLLFTAGCSSTPETSSPASVAPVSSIPPAAYTLAPGDTVTINFTYTPERNQNQIIRPDGNISLPVINDVQAAGLTTEALRTLLIKQYTTSGDLKNPDITVTVFAYGGNKIYVGGEVVLPGAIALVGPTTAYQAIVMAQGFRETAKRGNVMLVRRRSDGSTVSQILNMRSPTATGPGTGAALIEPRDVLFVPKTGIAQADTAVDQYFRQLIPINPSISATTANP